MIKFVLFFIFIFSYLSVSYGEIKDISKTPLFTDKSVEIKNDDLIRVIDSFLLIFKRVPDFGHHTYSSKELDFFQNVGLSESEFVSFFLVWTIKKFFYKKLDIYSHEIIEQSRAQLIMIYAQALGDFGFLFQRKPNHKKVTNVTYSLDEKVFLESWGVVDEKFFYTLYFNYRSDLDFVNAIPSKIRPLLILKVKKGRDSRYWATIINEFTDIFKRPLSQTKIHNYSIEEMEFFNKWNLVSEKRLYHRLFHLMIDRGEDFLQYCSFETKINLKLKVDRKIYHVNQELISEVNFIEKHVFYPASPDFILFVLKRIDEFESLLQNERNKRLYLQKKKYIASVELDQKIYEIKLEESIGILMKEKNLRELKELLRLLEENFQLLKQFKSFVDFDLIFSSLEKEKTPCLNDIGVFL